METFPEKRQFFNHFQFLIEMLSYLQLMFIFGLHKSESVDDDG